MPRFEKGSQEAKDFMAKIRNARNQPDYVPPANKKLTKKQKEAAEMKSAVVDIPIMGETTLIVPEYFAVPRKNGYKLVSPMSQERNLSSRRGKKSLKIVRKPVGDIVLVREDGAEEPLPLLAFSKKDRDLIKGHFKLVDKYKDKDPIDVPRIGRPKPAERGRPEKLPKNVAVHKQRKTRPGWSAKKSKKAEEDGEDDNIQMTVEEDEEETAAPAAYQRKKRQTYATDEERKEAIKQQKRDYARRKRAAAKGEGILSDIKSGFKKVADYATAVVKGRGNMYPPKVRSLLGRWGDKKVISAEIRRSPVQSVLTQAMNTLTFGQFSKNMSKTPYDKLFHLQIVLTLDHPSSPKLLVEKNEVINMDLLKSKGLKKGTEVLPVSPFNGVVLNDALEKTKKKMGVNRFFDYNAENNNCQDFILSLLMANGWGDKNDYDFVKQETKELFKGLSGLAKTAYTLTELGERANVAMTGRGGGSSKERVMVEKPKLTEAEIRKILADNERLKMINMELRDREIARIIDYGDPNKTLVRKPAQRMVDNISSQDFTNIEQKGRLMEELYKPPPIEKSKALTKKAVSLADAKGDSASAMNVLMKKMSGKGASATVGRPLEELIRQKFAEREIVVDEINALQWRTDAILMSSGVFADKLAEINSLEGERRRLLRIATQINNEIMELERRLAIERGEVIEDEEGGDTESESSSMEGEGMGSKYVVQSVIFKKGKYSVAEAKKWLKDNKYKSPKVDETENMLRFRQMSPSVVDKKGYTEYRTKPLGKSGIELILAYKGRIQGGSGRPKPFMPSSDEEEEEVEAPPTPPPAPPQQVQAPANFPQDMIYEIMTFLPQQSEIIDDYVEALLNSRATQLDALDRLERAFDRIPSSGDIRERRRLAILIAKIKRKLAAPPQSPIKKPALPRKRDDEDDDFSPPKIVRTSGNGMRKNY